MAKRLLATFAILLGILTLLGTVPATAAGNYETTYSKFIEQPAPAVPAFTVPGGTFQLHVKDGVQVQSVQAVSVLHGPYLLSVEGTQGSVLTVRVPADIVPDTYFLLIKTNDGTLVLPNGLKVFKEWPETLRLAWVSDTHVTSSAKLGFVCGDYFQRDIYALEKYCANPIPLHSVVATDSVYTYWSMKEVDILINTGDEVDSSSDLVGYNILYDIITRAAAAGQSYVGIKGNHDDPPTVYSKLIAPPLFYVTVGKFIIIGLDTGGDRGYPTMDEIEWMEKVLDEHKNYTPIVLYHHPYFFAPRWNYLGGVIKGLDPFDDNDWNELKNYLRYWAGDEAVARRFLEDVVKYNIPLTMSGHIHHDMYWRYVDREGHVHYFLTLTSTGAPDKESNPASHPGYSPTWYGSNYVIVSTNGSVEMPYVTVKFDGDKVKSDFMSIPVPQKFMVFRHESEIGTAVKFINELDESVTGPITLVIPEGAKIDPEHTNITYTVLGEREIGDKYYMLVNATVPVGVSQVVVTKESDGEKPNVQIAYLQPTHPKPNKPFMVYLTATDNLGIRDLYAEVLDENGNPVKYEKASRFPGEAGSGKPDNDFYTIELPPLKEGKYTLQIVAVDFYGNKAVVSKPITIKGYTPTSTSSTSTTTSSAGGICGPAVIVGLAVLPLLLRRRR